MMQETKSVLKQLGIRPDLKGYYYTIDYVQYFLERGIENVKLQEADDFISKKRGVTKRSIERAIRTAINRMHDSCDDGMIAGIFGSARINRGVFTRKEFLLTIAEHVCDGTYSELITMEG